MAEALAKKLNNAPAAQADNTVSFDAGNCACAQPAARPGMGTAGGGFPLALAGCGQPFTVTTVRGSGETHRFLESLGFVEGSEVSVVCENGGNLIVNVKGARVGLARQMAGKIMVKGRN